MNNCDCHYLGELLLATGLCLALIAGAATLGVVLVRQQWQRHQP